jgi:predicted O-methyltransferase YrrM
VRVLTHLVLWRLGLAEAESQTTPAERDCLARHAGGKRCVVEIGVWHGVTTRRLRAAMAFEGTLFAIDPFPVGRMGFSAQRHIARRELGKVMNGTVVWVRLTGAEAARAHRAASREPVDFVFIDGDHTYEGLRTDWEAWSPLVASTGIVALHDSRSTPARNIDEAGSVIFTREVILRDPRFAHVEAVDSLTVLCRVGVT